MALALMRTREVRLSKGALLMLGYSSDRYRASLYAIKRGQQGAEVRRYTADDPDLLRLLELIEDASELNLDPRTTERYLRSTPWGAELP